MWAPVMLTVTFRMSMVATWPLERDTGFLHRIKSAFITSQVHSLVVIFIFAQVVPARLLAAGDNPVLTVLATGCLFPFLGWLLRKFLINMSRNISISQPGRSSEQRTKTCVRE
jgi:hypothetical protein